MINEECPMTVGHWTLIIGRSRANAQLAGSNGVAHDVVDGELDELRALVAPALAFSAHICEPSLDIGDFARAQLVLEIEVLRDERLDPRAAAPAHWLPVRTFSQRAAHGRCRVG